MLSLVATMVYKTRKDECSVLVNSYIENGSACAYAHARGMEPLLFHGAIRDRDSRLSGLYGNMD